MWSCPCKWVENTSVKGILCKRHGWIPHFALSPQREVDCVKCRVGKGCCNEQEALQTLQRMWWHLKCLHFSAVQPKAAVRCLLLRSQGTPCQTGFGILLCLRTWAGVLLLLEYFFFSAISCSGNWKMDFKPFSFIWLCTLLLCYVTNNKVSRQFKNNDVWNLNLNELLIIAQIVFSISNWMNAHSFHIKYSKWTADLNIKMQ